MYNYKVNKIEIWDEINKIWVFINDLKSETKTHSTHVIYKVTGP